MTIWLFSTLFVFWPNSQHHDTHGVAGTGTGTGHVGTHGTHATTFGSPTAVNRVM
jgi:hypothetical protein